MFFTQSNIVWLCSRISYHWHLCITPDRCLVFMSQSWSKICVTSDLIFFISYLTHKNMNDTNPISLPEETHHWYERHYQGMWSFEKSVSLLYAWIDLVLLLVKPLNSWNLALADETLNPKGFTSTCSASRAITSTSSDSMKISWLSAMSWSVTLILSRDVLQCLWSTTLPQTWSINCWKVMEQGSTAASLLTGKERSQTHLPHTLQKSLSRSTGQSLLVDQYFFGYRSKI